MTKISISNRLVALLAIAFLLFHDSTASEDPSFSDYDYSFEVEESSNSSFTTEPSTNSCYVPDSEVYNLKLQISVVLTHFFPRDHQQVVANPPPAENNTETNYEPEPTTMNETGIRNCTLEEMGRVIIDLSEFVRAVWQAVENQSSSVSELEASKAELVEHLWNFKVRDVEDEAREFQHLLHLLDIALDSALEKVKTFKLRSISAGKLCPAPFAANETQISVTAHHLLDLLKGNHVETAADQFYAMGSPPEVITQLMETVQSAPSTNLPLLRSLLDFTELMSSGTAQAIALAGFPEAISAYSSIPAHWPSRALLLKHFHLVRFALDRARASLKSDLADVLDAQESYMTSVVINVTESWVEGEPEFHGIVRDILPPPVVAQIALKTCYMFPSKSQFEGVLRTLTLFNPAQRIQAYEALVEEMTKLDHIDTTQFVQLAFEIKALHNKTSIGQDLISNLPPAVRNLVFPTAPNCTLKNRSHNRFLYASESASLELPLWPHLLYLTQKYLVNLTAAYRWRFETENGGKTFKIWNGPRMLYAESERHHCTTGGVMRRFIGVASVDMLAGVAAGAAEWKVFPVDGGRYLRIVNSRYENEMLYADGEESIERDEDGKGVYATRLKACWGQIKLETLWEIQC